MANPFDSDTSRRGPSLRADAAWALAGNTTYAGCQWAMLVVLAKAGTPEIVGQFALGFAITAPIILFANLQLRAIQATDACHEFRFQHYMTLRLITTLLGFILCCVAAVIAADSASKAVTVSLIGLAKSVESISDVTYGLLQRRDKMKTIALSMMCKGVVSLFAITIVFVVTGSLACSCATLVIVWAAVLAGYDYPAAKRVLAQCGDPLKRLDWTPLHLRRLALLALPLGFVMGLSSLNANVPRYVIESFLGTRDVGLFAALASINAATAAVVNAVGQASSTRLADAFAGGRHHSFVTTTIRLVLMAATLGVTSVAVFVLTGPQLLILLYGSEYASLLNVLLGLLGAGALAHVASFLGYALTAARSFRSQVPIVAASVISTLIISIWLIPRLGLPGAVIGICSGSLVQIGASVWVLRQRLRTNNTLALELEPQW